jgi:cell division protein FtsL
MENEEDEEGFFVPVKNVWIVDKLRNEVHVRDEIITEKNKEIAELKEKIKELERKARE